MLLVVSVSITSPGWSGQSGARRACEVILGNTWYYSVEADQPPQLLAVPLWGEQVPAEPPLGVHAPGVREPVDAGAGDHDRAGDKDKVTTFLWAIR